MSEQERHERERADIPKDEGGSTTEEETPDVEAHRFDLNRVDEGGDRERVDEGSDRHRVDEGS